MNQRNWAELPDELFCKNCGEQICMIWNDSNPDDVVHAKNGEDVCGLPEKKWSSL